jgi:ubiquinone/menaquinone biosynthesis C-methylase UbiE
MAKPQGHPIFAAVYDQLTRSAERKFLGAHRAWLCARATGRVLDLGAGTGANLPYVRADAEVIAAEPDLYMLERARRRAEALGRAVTFLPDAAESLSLGAASVDTVLATLVLCTVDDPARALGEIRRVLRPGGRLLFLEHVRLDHPVWGRVQDVVTPLWRRLCGGCHPNRDTVGAIRRAGFTIGDLERYAFGPIPGPLFVRGEAILA